MSFGSLIFESAGPPVMPTLADFRSLFPELSTYTDGQVNLWLTQSSPFFDKTRWGDLLFLGVLNWVAHQLVMSKANTSQQVMDDGIMKKVGDIAKPREASLMNKQADNPYYRTYYGQQYLYYQQIAGIGSIAV